MNLMLRLGCLSLLAWSLTSTANAADLAGEWELNFPTDPTVWTFEQEASQFTATTGPIAGPPAEQYDMFGVTYGRWYAGVLLYSIPGTPVTDFPVGALAGSVDGDAMTGKLASYTLGTLTVSGTRVVEPPAP